MFERYVEEQRPQAEGVPGMLRVFFLAHFLVDCFFAIPLFFFPYSFLTFVGWYPIDVFAARLIAAMLFAMGSISLLYRDTEIRVYHALLTLKLIWSVVAIAGMTISMAQGAPLFSSFVILAFAVFAGAWVYYKIKLNALTS